MGKIRHIYHLIFITKGFKMSIPMNEKHILLDRIKYLFTRRDCHVYAVDAFLNHVHILVEIPQIDNFNKIINKVKGATGALHTKYPEYTEYLAWTSGFDSFSVSFSNLCQVKQYIENQQAIHQELSFEEEYRQLLEENGFTMKASSPVSLPPINNPKDRNK